MFQDVKETRDVSSDTKAVVFNRTPIMSTYLLAFIVGEFDFVEDKDSNGTVVRVYTPVGKKEQGRFALQVRQTPCSSNFFPFLFFVISGCSKDDSILYRVF